MGGGGGGVRGVVGGSWAHVGHLNSGSLLKRSDIPTTGS